MKKNILFFGAGRMGGSILSKLINECSEYYNFFIVDPFVVKSPGEFKGKCQIYKDVKACTQENVTFDVVFIAVKPQMFLDVAPQINSITAKYTVIISVMAGISCESIGLGVNNTQQIIRSMPNIAATVGYSASTCFAGEHVLESSRKQASEVMETVGSCYWVDDEDLLHAVTGVSGSGPAYFFAFVEAMSAGGELMGLEPALANNLAVETMIGAAMLLIKNNDATRLRQTVTSPNGTTAAALDSLSYANSLNKLVHSAIRSAVERSIELSK